MKILKLVLLLVLFLVAILFFLQNTTPVHARFLWFYAEMPMIALLFLTATGAFLAGVLATLYFKMKT